MYFNTQVTLSILTGLINPAEVIHVIMSLSSICLDQKADYHQHLIFQVISANN